MDGAGALDRDFQRSANLRVQRVQGCGDLLRRDSHRLGAGPVERRAVVEGCGRSAPGHIVDDGPDGAHHGVDVHAAAGQGGAQLRGAQGAAAQVDAGQGESGHCSQIVPDPGIVRKIVYASTWA